MGQLLNKNSSVSNTVNSVGMATQFPSMRDGFRMDFDFLLFSPKLQYSSPKGNQPRH